MYTGVAAEESQILRLRRALTRTRQGSNVVQARVSPRVDTRARLSWTVAVYVLFCQEQVLLHWFDDRKVRLSPL